MRLNCGITDIMQTVVIFFLVLLVAWPEIALSAEYKRFRLKHPRPRLRPFNRKINCRIYVFHKDCRGTMGKRSYPTYDDLQQSNDFNTRSLLLERLYQDGAVQLPKYDHTVAQPIGGRYEYVNDVTTSDPSTPKSLMKENHHITKLQILKMLLAKLQHRQGPTRTEDDPDIISTTQDNDNYIFVADDLYPELDKNEYTLESVASVRT